MVPEMTGASQPGTGLAGREIQPVRGSRVVWQLRSGLCIVRGSLRLVADAAFCCTSRRNT